MAQRIEHVGSTSVTGLAAKPIIDMQLSVDDVENEESYLGPMENAGYVLRVREPGHRMFRTPELNVQINVCGTGSDWGRRHLLFRDWLRRSPEDRARYEAAKRLLVRREWEDMNEYADAKNVIIREISERAGSWAATTGWRPIFVEQDRFDGLAGLSEVGRSDGNFRGDLRSGGPFDDRSICRPRSGGHSVA